MMKIKVGMNVRMYQRSEIIENSNKRLWSHTIMEMVHVIFQ